VDGAAVAADSPSVARTTSTPAGRNAGPFMNRSPCRGSTSCTPICPVRAKYDPREALRMALDTGRAELLPKAVVDAIHIDDGGAVTGLHYLTYDDVSVPAATGRTGEGVATADVYVLAAHAIENARILLNSERVTGRAVANSSGLVGRHLMDHPVYLAWGLMPAATPFYGYRGPQSTSGVETLRDGAFRRRRAAWRIELGNAGWTWPIGDPYVTGADFVYGRNDSGVNPERRILANREYISTVNGILTRQLRLAFLVEQEADPSNRVELSDAWTDNLGIPRPRITYGVSDYVRAGFASARAATERIMALLGATDHTVTGADAPAAFRYEGQDYNYRGAGHMCGTHIMGSAPGNSVVDASQRTWDHPNLYLAGCGSMPSVGTQNPTLTMLALACRTADEILARLG
jgi:choline dehydrogenase-like flavoprotein